MPADAVGAIAHDASAARSAGAADGSVTRGTAARIGAHLDRLYRPELASRLRDELVADMTAHLAAHPPASQRRELFNERDTILITYADQLRSPDRSPLATLQAFLDARVGDTITGVHLLPFYPWSSDDGFSVIDYGAVDPAVGSWEDVAAIAASRRLMVDAVFNHISSESPWVESWRNGDPAWERLLITVDPQTDLSRVVRPRADPLLTPLQTARGTEHVWSTFGGDQLDLNYAEPEVLRAVTRHLLDYLRKGAQIIRLDAVAFLWKELGTSCIHLPETHEIIKLWRTIVDAVAPGTLLITETNVPHHENVRYFGDGHDEAHLVYQFPLAPLTLHAFTTGDARHLNVWAEGLHPPSETTTFFNFLGSHDGVGVRPAEGLLPDTAIEQLVGVVRDHGGGVSMRANADGSLSPYELNTTFFDALNSPDPRESQSLQLARFRSAHALLVALAGVPGIYVQALLGSRNWTEGMRQTGRARSINRQRFELGPLLAELDELGHRRHEAFATMLGLLEARSGEPAFHPNAPQRLVWAHPSLVVLLRTRRDGSRGVLCVSNVSGELVRTSISRLAEVDLGGPLTDLLGGNAVRVRQEARLHLEVEPYGCAWLRGSPVP